VNVVVFRRPKLPQPTFARLVVVILAGLYLPAAYHPNQKPRKQPRAEAKILFENRQARSGIDFVLNNGTTEDKHMIDSTLGGVGCFDYDGDGFLDVFFTNGARIPSLIKENESFHNRLYRNNHDGTFTDVTQRAGVAGEGYSMGATAGDFDNDGWADLYVGGVNKNILYHNNGNGTFTDVTEQAGVAATDATGRKLWSVAGAWVDYNNDGYLDLFVASYLNWDITTAKKCGRPGKRLACSPVLYEGLPSFLYRNNGDGTFTDVSISSGIGKHIGKGMGVAVADYDDNGFIDIFMTNDNETNFLFRNLDGQTFAEVGVEAGVALTDDGIPVSNMGVDFRDINNDGRPDVFIPNLAGETFRLFLNDGQSLFADASYKSGIGLATAMMSGWGGGIYDFDNDGNKDIFTSNSHVSENVHLYSAYQYKLPNAVLQNQGDGSFRNVAGQAGEAMRVASAHRGCAFCDLNNDGKMDVIVSVIADQPEVLYNTSSGGNHWILIQTEGKTSNRDGIGTKIRLVGQSGLVQYNHVTTSGSYGGTLDRRVHFGLGWDSRIREIELHWPSGKVQILKDVPADQILKVKED
jgi:enediyne biosynthesis protein E4